MRDILWGAAFWGGIAFLAFIALGTAFRPNYTRLSDRDIAQMNEAVWAEVIAQDVIAHRHGR